MGQILVALLIGLICYGLIVLIQKGEKAAENRRRNEAFKQTQKENESKKSIEPLYNELYGAIENKYNEYLKNPEYKRTGFPFVTTEKAISLYCEDIDIKDDYLERFEIWKNDNNLCFLSNLDWIKRLANDYLAMAACGDKSQYQKEDELRKHFKKPSVQVYAFYIPINNIEYFNMGGKKYVTTDIVGGGGGGSSIKGAVVGGLIAGETGAIIGSRKKVDPIQTRTNIHDETECYIKYKTDDNSLLEVVCKKYADIFFNALKKTIPEKEYAYVLSKQAAPANNDNIIKSDSIEDKLKTLQSLLDKGLITEKEYEDKRNEIISSI